jgi:hypothetical protein
MATVTGNHIARKKSTDAKGGLGSSSSSKARSSFKRNGGDGNALHDARSRSKKPLSRNASLTISDAEQITRSGGDAYVRTCSHALEDALLSFHDMKLQDEKTKKKKKKKGEEAEGEDRLASYLPLVNIGDSIVSLARDERLIEETKRRKLLKRMKDAESFSKDHYKYSLFAGEMPMEEETPPHLELTPQEHIEIARNSIAANALGVHHSHVRGHRPSKRDRNGKDYYNKYDNGSQLEKKSRRYDSEASTILVYADRPPVFIPKLDFSSLPNFRKPRLYNQQRVKGHLKKAHPNKAKPKGLIGFLSLKFGF